MNLKESGEEYMEGLGRRKGEGEMKQLQYDLKNKTKKKKGILSRNDDVIVSPNPEMTCYSSKELQTMRCGRPGAWDTSAS